MITNAPGPISTGASEAPHPFVDAAATARAARWRPRLVSAGGMVALDYARSGAQLSGIIPELRDELRAPRPLTPKISGWVWVSGPSRRKRRVACVTAHAPRSPGCSNRRFSG